MNQTPEQEEPWRTLNAGMLERTVQQRDGYVTFEELDCAYLKFPDLRRVFSDWGRGLTLSIHGIPAEDWMAFLKWLRHKHAKRNHMPP